MVKDNAPTILRLYPEKLIQLRGNELTNYRIYDKKTTVDTGWRYPVNVLYLLEYKQKVIQRKSHKECMSI
jgi:hypothetical protein